MRAPWPVVRRQAELAPLARDWPDLVPILWGGPFVVGGEAAVDDVGETAVELYGRTQATVRNHARAVARDETCIVAYDDAEVVNAEGSGVTVVAYDRARVVARNSRVALYGQATADAYGRSEIEAWDDSLVRVRGCCLVAATDRVRVVVHAADASDTLSTCALGDDLLGRPTVIAAGQAKVAVYVSAFVRLHHRSSLVCARAGSEIELAGDAVRIARVDPQVPIARLQTDERLEEELDTLAQVRALIDAVVPKARAPFSARLSGL